jgi:hypothetical protein
MTVVCPPSLSALYRQGRLIPFVGAGISAGVSWTQDGEIRSGPTWEELVDQAARLIGFDDASLLRVRGTDLQILEYYRLKRHGEVGELTNWLVNNMHPSDDDLRGSTIHSELAALNRCSLFYTTNYDDFIERAFELNGRACTKIAIEGHIADALRQRTEPGTQLAPEVIKFHGDLTVPDNMVLSEADYESRLALQNALDHRLRSDLLGRAVLFLGYSFRDWNVAYLFRLVQDTFNNLPGSIAGRRAYIAIADPSAFETTLFDSRNIEVISIDGASQSEDIASLIQQLHDS